MKKILKQIFESLNYLHEQNIIHRDIKPENFIADSNKNIFLCDFDLAKIIEDYNLPKTKGVSTLYYKAPEILLGSIHYDNKIDIWGVGCIICEMILQNPIFESRQEIGVLFKIFDLIGYPNVKLKHFVFEIFF